MNNAQILKHGRAFLAAGVATIVALLVIHALLSHGFSLTHTNNTATVDGGVCVNNIVYTTVDMPEIHNEPVSALDAFDYLGYFVSNDTTDNRVYIPGDYSCVDFSIDFAQNITDAGYEAGVVLCSHRGHGGHALCWVTMPEPYTMLYIEPMIDSIYYPDVYTNQSGDWTFREISIDQAIRHNADMRRWGIK